jgi:hypothetical protein
MLVKLVLAVCSSLILAGAVLAAPAHASTSQESIFQDDGQLVFSNDAERRWALNQMKALGATTVRSVVYWEKIAPDGESTTKPSHFNGARPGAYPPGAWSRYDGLVSEAQARGLQVILTPGEGPAWAARCQANWSHHQCNPNPREYRAFVTALGRRYPTVHRWSLWNEPNQTRSLEPQQALIHGRIVPVAAVMYRQLLRVGVAGLRASGHAHDQVLLGELAPLGLKRAPLAVRSVKPIPFYQTLFCVDALGRPLHGQAARDAGCSGKYTPLAVTGVAVHPYTRAATQGPTWSPGAASGELPLANLSALNYVIAQGVRAHRIPGGLPFYFTEYGFQTNPPDPLFGNPLSAQARWIDQADWIAYQNPRVKAVAQYALIDDTPVDGFQTGLFFSDGRAKPALAAYRLPIWVTPSGSGVRVWGQVRPARSTPRRVRILNGYRSFRLVRTVRTSAAGYFEVLLPRKPGRYWRLAWTPRRGKTFFSRRARVCGTGWRCFRQWCGSGIAPCTVPPPSGGTVPAAAPASLGSGGALGLSGRAGCAERPCTGAASSSAAGAPSVPWRAGLRRTRRAEPVSPGLARCPDWGWWRSGSRTSTPGWPARPS